MAQPDPYHALVSGTNLTSQYREIERLVEVSLTFRICIAVIYFLTAIVAFVSNLLAILLLVYGPRRSRQLNQFLANLGASDILFAICNIPFTYITLVYNTWWLPNFLCPLSSFVQVLAPTVAFYTLIAIGIGRYFVIVTGHELLFLTKSRHTKIAIILIWLFAIILAAPILFVSKISPVMYENKQYVECSEDWSRLEAFWPASSVTGNTVGEESETVSSTLTSHVHHHHHRLPTASPSATSSVELFTYLLAAPTSTPASVISSDSSDSDSVQSQVSSAVVTSSSRIGQLYTIIVFVLTFILPVVTLTYLYGHIGLIVYKHQLPVGNESHITNQNLTQTKIKVVKMLLILVISFIICWSPAQIFYLMLWVFEDIRQDTVSQTHPTQYEPGMTSSSPFGANSFHASTSSSSFASLSLSPSSSLPSSSSSSSMSPLYSSTVPPTVSSGLGASSTSSWYSILYYTMYFSFHWLSCAHTIINPFVYCFFSNNFQRSDLIAILMCRSSTPDRNKRRSVNLGHSSVAIARNNSLNHQNNNNNNNNNNNGSFNNDSKNGRNFSNFNKQTRNNHHKETEVCEQNNNLIVHKARNLIHRTSMPTIQLTTINNNGHNHHSNAHNSQRLAQNQFKLSLKSDDSPDSKQLSISKTFSQPSQLTHHSQPQEPQPQRFRTNDCVVSIRNHSHNDQPYNDV